VKEGRKESEGRKEGRKVKAGRNAKQRKDDVGGHDGVNNGMRG
jgi:hypothetical protein